MSNLLSLSAAQLNRAATLKDRIEALSQQLTELLGSPVSNGAAAPANKPARKQISAAGIARIKAAQKVRWAKFKQQTAPAALADSVPDTKLTVNPPAKAKSASSAHARLDRGPAAQPA